VLRCSITTNQISLVHLRPIIRLYTMAVHPLLRLDIIRINLLLLPVLLRSIRCILCRITRTVLLHRELEALRVALKAMRRFIKGTRGTFRCALSISFDGLCIPSICYNPSLSQSPSPITSSHSIVYQSCYSSLFPLLSQSDTYRRQLVDTRDSMFFSIWSK
jgi:hypothetical protein